MSKHILAVSSGGGHWHQLNIIAKGFSHHQVSWMTTVQNHAAGENSPVIQLPDADSTQPFRLIRLAILVFGQVLRMRPDVIISTGAAIGFFAVLAGRLVGARTIWVDSIANYQQLSMSGKYSRRICHLHLTQWPELADETTQHWGAVI